MESLANSAFKMNEDYDSEMVWVYHCKAFTKQTYTYVMCFKVDRDLQMQCTSTESIIKCWSVLKCNNIINVFHFDLDTIVGLRRAVYKICIQAKR